MRHLQDRRNRAVSSSCACVCATRKLFKTATLVFNESQHSQRVCIGAWVLTASGPNPAKRRRRSPNVPTLAKESKSQPVMPDNSDAALARANGTSGVGATKHSYWQSSRWLDVASPSVSGEIRSTNVCSILRIVIMRLLRHEEANTPKVSDSLIDVSSKTQILRQCCISCLASDSRNAPTKLLYQDDNRRTRVAR